MEFLKVQLIIYKQSVDAVEVNIIRLSAPETIFVEYPTVDPVDILVTFLFQNIILNLYLVSAAWQTMQVQVLMTVVLEVTV